MKDLGETGYLHRLGSDTGNAYRVPAPPSLSPRLPLSVWIPTADYFVKNLDRHRARHFAQELGVSVLSLRRLDCGWDVAREAYTFPMRTDRLEIIGIRTRHLNGDKRAIKGSRSGIFVASKPSLSGVVYVCEGPTDTAGMLSLGLEALGRPSCTGGAGYISAIVNRYRYRHIIIMADNDGPGRQGAQRLYQLLAADGQATSLVIPPEKDIREWIKKGATRREVEALTEACHG